MKIALLLRGITYKKEHAHWTGKVVNIDYKSNVSNVLSMVVHPLCSLYDTDVFIVTYQSKERPIQDIIQDFAPIKDHVLLESNTCKQMDCFLAGLKLIKSSNKKYDFVIVSRFDLELKEPITDIPFQLDKFNFLWYEKCMDNRVGDCMHFFHSKWIDIFIKCMEECPFKTCCHYIKNYLDKYLDNKDFNIIHDKCYDSNTDENTNPIYSIKRGDIIGFCTFNPAAKVLGKNFNKFFK